MFVKHLVQTWSGKTWQSSVYFYEVLEIIQGEHDSSARR